METPIFQTNPRLRVLLLILIFTFALSGITLAILAQIQAYSREQVYLATESALPVHREKGVNGANGTQGEVEGWKTYQNEEYGFEFKYPQQMYFIGDLSNKDNTVYSVWYAGADEGHQIEFSIKNTGEKDSGSLEYLKDISGIGFTWKKYLWNLEFFEGQPIFVYKYKNIRVDVSGRSEKIAEQILSTFKFTNSANISNWKTYSNTNYGFEIQYPAGAAVGDKKQSINLGTAQAPVYGVEIMGATLVELSNSENRKSAQAIFNQMVSYLALPEEAYKTGEMPPPECSMQAVNNPNISVEAIYCTGEGGPAYYAYIHSSKADFFLDGYPARGLNITLLNQILSTFKFIK